MMDADLYADSSFSTAMYSPWASLNMFLHQNVAHYDKVKYTW